MKKVTKEILNIVLSIIQEQCEDLQFHEIDSNKIYERDIFYNDGYIGTVYFNLKSETISEGSLDYFERPEGYIYLMSSYVKLIGYNEFELINISTSVNKELEKYENKNIKNL